MPGHVLLPTGEWRLWRQFALRGPGFPAAGVLRLAPDALATAADKFDAGEVLRGEAWDEFTEQFGEAAVATAHELQDIAGSGPFREALAWQNRALLRTGIAPFLAWTPSATGRTSMPRQREELVAHYWQRFCVKNDTIGFFGPVGWGTLDPGAQGVVVDPGTGLTEYSRVYFASWAIDALAQTIEADPAIRAALPPRRVPFVRVDGGVDGGVDDASVTVPGRPAQAVEAGVAELLRRCDGTRPVAELAEQVSAAGYPFTPDEAAAHVAELVRRRWAVQRLDVPTCPDPELRLRAALERLPATPARASALERLDTLVAARDRVGAAMGDPDAVAAAIGELEVVFTELTEAAAQREKGARTAPCRGLVYSDARRSATAVVGAGVLDRLTPLEMCLTAARWMTDRVAAVVGARIRETYDRLAATGPVDLGALWMQCLPAPHALAGADVDAVVAELRARWDAILDVPADAPVGQHRVQRRSADIAEGVRAAFDEPGRGWDLARYISPDVIVLARDAAAVRRGDVDVVLGELHVAMNTIGASLFVMQHPDIPSLLEETSTDFPGPRVLPMLHKEKPPRWSARSRPALVRPEDNYVALVDHTADPQRPRRWFSADVRVEPRDVDGDPTGLALVLPDGSEFPLLDVFGHSLTAQVMDRFTLRPDGDHTPRITVDRVVVSRETWRFDPTAMGFADEKDEARRFVRARQWRAEHELPRFVFVVLPTEPRPFYVDFDSPVYVTILAKAVRRLARQNPAGRITVSEMLPDPEQAWLTDDAGAEYTSEFRFVAVDQRGADR